MISQHVSMAVARLAVPSLAAAGAAAAAPLGRAAVSPRVGLHTSALSLGPSSSQPAAAAAAAASAAAAAAAASAATSSASSARRPTGPSAPWTPAAASVRPYQHRPTSELLNSLAVFQMCALPGLVAATPAILDTAERLGASAPLNAVIKATFFRHFCGGEDLPEVLPTMKAYESAGIGSILDLALEADLDAAALTGAAAADQAVKIAGMFKQSIEIASHQPDNFIAIKVTALFPPALLQRWSTTLTRLKEVFDAAAASDAAAAGGVDAQGAVEIARLAPRIEAAFPGVGGRAAELLAAARADGRVEWTDVAGVFSLHAPQRAAMLVRDAPAAAATADTAEATHDDVATAALIVPHVDDLCAFARARGVRLMVDAEQTYFQPAIDDVALGLCAKFNPRAGEAVASTTTPGDASASAPGGLRTAVVYNTYQMYLVDAYARLVADTRRAARLGVSFGAKIVRGAYMVSERERAAELGIADPIQPSLEATHASYNRAVTFLVDTMARNKTAEHIVRQLAFVVASHNKDSVKLATGMMAQHGLSAVDGAVGFAQLMGMQDATTYSLAANGFRAYKYIPYGPVQVTVPYLHRRAQENSAVLGAVSEDKRNLLTELKIRMGLVRV
ncbi:proline dehydrogenase [Polyrhizophydium stewartii]|uniref:Proline dehydrogenase n=1 Tax=Polyrhizophydium stewartii TaxID=2732419 RepID=A0ABR4MZD9_9FUNG